MKNKLALKTRNTFEQEIPIYFRLSQYANNDNLYVGMVTDSEGYEEPFQDLTVNLEKKCDDNCAFIDVNNNGEDIILWLIENGLGNLTGDIDVSGYCIYPEFRFNMDVLLKYVHPLSADAEDEAEDPTDECRTDERYFAYDAEDNCVSDGFRYKEDAIAHAKKNNYPVVKIHRYFYDERNKIRPDGMPEEIWRA